MLVFIERELERIKEELVQKEKELEQAVAQLEAAYVQLNEEMAEAEKQLEEIKAEGGTPWGAVWWMQVLSLLFVLLSLNWILRICFLLIQCFFFHKKKSA